MQYPKGSGKKDRIGIRRLVAHFLILKGKLYHKGFDGTIQLYVNYSEKQAIMVEVHGCECGPHMNGRMLAREILRARVSIGALYKMIALALSALASNVRYLLTSIIFRMCHYIIQPLLGHFQVGA